MRRLSSVRAQWVGRKLLRMALVAAVAGAVPFADAQQMGNASGAMAGHIAGSFGYRGGAASFNQNFSAPSAPQFVSTFGPHSVSVGPRVGVPGVMRTTPDYAASWGVVSRPGPVFDGRRDGDHHRGRDGDHDRDRDHHRSGYGGYGFYGALPIYSTWALPWAGGYVDEGSSGNEESAQPAEYQPRYDEHRPAYPAAENDYAPPPPAVATAAVPAAPPTPLRDEPALTLIFKDGRHQSVRNYAVTRSSVIVLDDAASGRQQRIPLAELDLSATKQAAELAGLDFNPPA